MPRKPTYKEVLSALKARLVASPNAIKMEIPRYVLADAADTIERLQKDNDQLRYETTELNERTFKAMKQERDAALAEVERLKREVEVAQDNMNFITRQDRDFR